MTELSSTPPIEAGDLELPPAAPGWPKAIGITSIVWGSLWLLCGACGSVWFVAAPQFMKMAEQQMGSPAPQVMMPSAAQIVLTVFGTFVSGLLVVAGVSTVRRKASGRILHLIFGVVSLIESPLAAVIGWQQQAAIQKWVQENPADKWAQQQQQGGAVGMIVLIIMTVIALIWPVFCVFWFGVLRKRPEEGAPDLSKLI